MFSYEAGRFWISNETADKDQKQKVAALTMRSISYTGEFQPVKWKCRAPLASGKLCERMDREKVHIFNNSNTPCLYSQC